MIRTATTEDANAVADVCIGSRKTHIPYAMSAHTDAEVRGWIRNHLIPEQDVKIWEQEGEIEAVIATSENENESWINQLYVRAESVGRGFGSKLLKDALLNLKRPIMLYTFQENRGARRFYERYGFRAIKFTDGNENEEKCPDVLYSLENNQPNKSVDTTPASAPR